MHPPEAHDPANRSDGAENECHCLEILHVEKLRHNEKTQNPLGACALVNGEQRKYPVSDRILLHWRAKKQMLLASLLIGVSAAPLSIVDSSGCSAGSTIRCSSIIPH